MKVLNDSSSSRQPSRTSITLIGGWGTLLTLLNLPRHLRGLASPYLKWSVQSMSLVSIMLKDSGHITTWRSWCFGGGGGGGLSINGACSTGFGVLKVFDWKVGYNFRGERSWRICVMYKETSRRPNSSVQKYAQLWVWFFDWLLQIAVSNDPIHPTERSHVCRQWSRVKLLCGGLELHRLL